MAHSAKDMRTAIIENLKGKTGKTVDEWIGLIPKELIGDRKRVVAWLKDSHGVGHYQAVTIFEEAVGSNAYDDREAIETALFGNEGSELRQWYGELDETIRALAPEVESVACRTYIPYRFATQFAVLAPGKGTIRLGLALGDRSDRDGLRPAVRLGGSDRITHEVELPPGRPLDEAVEAALREACERNSRRRSPDN